MIKQRPVTKLLNCATPWVFTLDKNTLVLPKVLQTWKWAQSPYLRPHLRQCLHPLLQLLLHFRQVGVLRQLLFGELQFFLDGGYLFVLELWVTRKQLVLDSDIFPTLILSSKTSNVSLGVIFHKFVIRKTRDSIRSAMWFGGETRALEW